MRRIATVTSSVSLASIASPSVCMRVKPPVPSSSREREARARRLTSGRRSVTFVAAAWSSALRRRDDLHARAVGERARRPHAAARDLGVDGDRDARPCRDRCRRSTRTSRIVGLLGRLSTGSPLTKITPAPRDGRREARGSERAGGGSRRSRPSTTMSARDRREQDPVAVMAGRPVQARRARRRARAPARCRASPGAGPPPISSTTSSCTPGTSSPASRSSS